ncbi:MAG: FAD-dependent oxidoreductase [Verrucomicrobia bacterium]|nr:FAD-dependent oxidoreductase [Verrucomicrobiota bacterium]
MIPLPQRESLVAPVIRILRQGIQGGALAYFWSKRAAPDRILCVLEMDDPASGASGRNEGAVVMGRYFAVVRDTVRADLRRVRPELNDEQREQLARQFANAYCLAGYRSGELIAKTVVGEKFDCEYRRNGWVQSKDGMQAALDESVRLAAETGFTDWTKITPEEVFARSGMRTKESAGFSKGCASWHPARWVWCLFRVALSKPNLKLFTRTRVLRVEDAGEYYRIHTTRGMLRARNVVNATESYTPGLHPQFRGKIEVRQTQAAVGDGGPAAMKPNVVISGTKAFWERQYIIAGMVGAGSNVSFNAGRCIVNRILGCADEPDDYPPEFFAPTRVLDPKNHPWPKPEPGSSGGGRDRQAA